MAPALVLNATFEPIAVVSTKRAIVLVLADKAEIVEASDDEWRSAAAAIKVPAVIRLRRYVRVPYRTRVPLSRQALMRRDGHVCAYCGKRASTIDHVVPRSKGGPHTWENVVAACARCNSQKADKTLAQLGWTLPFTPKAPHGTGWLVLGVADRDPSWEPYLDAQSALAGA